MGLMKTCRKCGQEKPETDFHRSRTAADGRQGWCKVCRVASKRKQRAANPEHYRARAREHRKTEAAMKRHYEYKQRNREKVLAHKAVNRAIAAGRLVRPLACPSCGATDVQIHAHHEDYSRQLDVEWLCPRCHAVAHADLWAARSERLAAA
jgi:predicted RNA-binding Zn-ribbon protein involved in translation (DUF1610 family)